MKLGLQINGFDWEGGPASFAAKLAEVARAAEEAGFDRIGVADHLWQHPIMGGPEANEPECYATLAFLAANTEGSGSWRWSAGSISGPRRYWRRR